ncbi:MAG: glutamine--fructose-6-phosphate transaminase (isomerizing), partial [Candidatus Omnitrophota bacterium]
MCGIFGYTGNKQAQSIVMTGLKRLEYRGYDSSGIAVEDGSNTISVEKTHGKIKNLEVLLKSHPLKGTTAIGHTRWATHGTPNQLNAHPHLDGRDSIAVVHNGIIENYYELKKVFQDKGVKFRSETDTEVIVHLIAHYYKGNLENAVKVALKDLKGTYAIAVICAKEPGRIVAAKFDSPLVLGLGKGENFLASDVSAFLEHTKDVIFIENNQIVTLDGPGYKITDFEGKPLNPKPVQINWDVKQAQKGGFPHFMIKEIFEQPSIISAILRERVQNGRIHFDELFITPAAFKKIKNITIIACGTAFHAGLTARYVLEELTPLPVAVETSSEFRYRDPKVSKDTLVIAVSQSGETADTLAGLREAKRKKALTLTVCNVLASSLAREAQGVVYTHAGPEIAVASTKAYTAQLAVLYLLAIYLGELFGTLPKKKKTALLKEFMHVPALLQEVLDGYKTGEEFWRNNVHDFNVRYHQQLAKYTACDPRARKRAPNGFFLYLGRGINYPNALEGALKLKE